MVTKKDLEKYALIISIIGLIVSSSLTAILTFYGFQLTEQANSIAQKSLDLQNKLSDFTPNIILDADYVHLDGGVLYTSETSSFIESFGVYNFSILVFTPYFGTISVDINDFDAFGPILKPDKVNLTDLNCEFWYDRKSHEQPVISGLNKRLQFTLVSVGLS